MHLKISVKDENDVELDTIEVLQDGSDSEGSERIRNMIKYEFKHVADPTYDEFECMGCGKVDDIDGSVIDSDGDMICEECWEKRP